MLIELFFIGLLAYVMLGPKGGLVVQLHRIDDSTDLTFVQKAICYIPIYNSVLAKKALGKSGAFELVVFILFIVLEVFNIIAKFALDLGPAVNVVASLAAVTGFIMWYISEVILMISIVPLFQTPIYYILVLVPAFSASLAAVAVGRTINNSRHELGGTFNGQSKARTQRV